MQHIKGKKGFVLCNTRAKKIMAVMMVGGSGRGGVLKSGKWKGAGLMKSAAPKALTSRFLH